MLPPLMSFPAPALAFFIAADACLTARKHLRQRQPAPPRPARTYEMVLMRNIFVNSSTVAVSSTFACAIPACGGQAAGAARGAARTYVREEDVEPALLLERARADARDRRLVRGVRLQNGDFDVRVRLLDLAWVALSWWPRRNWT
jgi:hypothetical protein